MLEGLILSDRAATLAEFEDFLRTTNNRDGRPYEEASINAYVTPGKNLTHGFALSRLSRSHVSASRLSQRDLTQSGSGQSRRLGCRRGFGRQPVDTMTLWRPTGQEDIDLVASMGHEIGPVLETIIAWYTSGSRSRRVTLETAVPSSPRSWSA